MLELSWSWGVFRRLVRHTLAQANFRVIGQVAITVLTTPIVSVTVFSGSADLPLATPEWLEERMSTGHVKVATVNSTSYVNLVNVPDTPGVLTAVGVASGAKYHYFRITIDGTEVVNDMLVGSNATTVSANHGLGIALPFAGSLQVDVRDAPNASALTKYWASWTTHHSEPIGGPEFFEDEVDGQRFLRERQQFGDRTTHYVVDSLLGPMRWSQVVLESDYCFEQEPVVGTVSIWEEPFHTPAEVGPVPLIIRPHGYTRVLDRIYLDQFFGAARFEHRDSDFLAHEGSFEIIADLPATANIPATFFRQ